ncbi:auxin-induced protein 22D-like [Zingiber officinale]|uniref:auxin-induced protein 22D-like n=1 Tax=Zingiber officinale TaxID=94328 RepID=UPI001C4D04C2|nr:auxin-induced protein 22D-like [Zingiber officinale]
MEAMASYVKDTELRLGLPGSDASEKPVTRGGKRALLEDESDFNDSSPEEDSGRRSVVASPMAKAQLVGWPPIRTYRKNNFQARKAETEPEAVGLFVKVSMDGAPYLRKIDLKVYKGYKEFREALDIMFKCFSLGEVSRKEGSNGCEYAIIYEDKDGDLMLVGDVPWEMFISSCKRLRIVKGYEARSLKSSQPIL